MDDSWTVSEPAQVDQAQEVWDAMDRGDPMPALDSLRDDVLIENGPGAGPWRRIEGKAAFLDMYGGSFQSSGRPSISEAHASSPTSSSQSRWSQRRDGTRRRVMYSTTGRSTCIDLMATARWSAF